MFGHGSLDLIIDETMFKISRLPNLTVVLLLNGCGSQDVVTLHCACGSSLILLQLENNKATWLRMQL